EPKLMKEMYPGMREIFLVRDFRDVATSIFEFNAKRNYAEFGRERVDSDEEFLHVLRRDAASLLDQWLSRSTDSYLARYEDLVVDPVTELQGILNYVGLDSSRETIEGMIERSSVEDA